MIAGLGPYPVTRESGVPSLGLVPRHWQVRRLRTAVEMRVSNVDKHAHEGGLPVRLCNYVDVYKNDRIHSTMPFMRATATRDELTRFGISDGDVLITKDSESWDDIGVPALVVDSADDLVCGYHLAMLRPSAGLLSGAYLFRLIQSTGVAHQLHVNANGVTRYGLTHSGIKSVWLPIAPRDEQDLIVRFLDHADVRIRRYIRAKQRLIELLEEQQQAIIHRAVTRGLDSNAPLKPSGVDWLGDVPDHWRGGRLKAICSMKSGAAITTAAIEPSGDYPVYGGNGIRGYSTRYTHTGEFALVGRQGALCGNVHIVRGSFWASEHAVVVTPRSGYDLEWLGALLRVMNLNQYSLAAAQPGLAVERIRELRVAVPNILEQQAIVRHVDRQTAPMTDAAERARKEIELLHEYRTRLIADIVTGKLDVREAAAALPNEPNVVAEMDEFGLVDGADYLNVDEASA